MTDENGHRHEADVNLFIERAGRLVDDWHKRTIVWLALANAAGLAAVAQRIASNPTRETWLVPSAWLFLLGLILCGWVGRVWHIHFGVAASHLLNFRTNPSLPVDPAAMQRMKMANRIMLSAALSFLAGVLLPLIGVTLLAFGIKICTI